MSVSLRPNTYSPTANKRDVPYQSLIKVWLQEKADSE